MNAIDVEMVNDNVDSSLVAYYPFNGNANDVSGNGRNATVYGDSALTTGKDNSSNSAYYFDGNGDYLEHTASIPNFPAEHRKQVKSKLML